MGPINKLQNALSFNYFANTQVYDPRADYISKSRIVSIEDSFVPGATPTSFTTDAKAATEPSFNYKIVDGKSYRAYIESLNNSITRELINDAEQASDQVKNEEAVNSGPANQEQVSSGATSGTTSGSTIGLDEEVIKSIIIDGHKEVNEGDDTLTIKLTFNPPQDKPNLKFVFSEDKIFKGNLSLERLYASNIDNINSFITARKNTNESTIFKGDSEVTLSPTDKTWSLDVPLTNNDLDFLLKAKNDTTQERYSLVLKWNSSGAKSSIGYTDSLL
jgi:hypothetical protein